MHLKLHFSVAVLKNWKKDILSSRLLKVQYYLLEAAKKGSLMLTS